MEKKKIVEEEAELGLTLGLRAAGGGVLGLRRNRGVGRLGQGR